MKASETLRAPAKLNLTLEVLQRRDDGLHALRSVMVPVDLCDEIVLSPAPEFAFSCDVPELQAQNLAARAFAALPLPDSRVRIELHKRIPTGAGMGGGSSDAAAILLAASRGAFGECPDADYFSLARSLGSDVPFFLAECAALVEGTGERVTALGRVPAWHAVVVKPAAAISTAWAYEQIDRAPRPSRPRNASVSLRMAEALQRGEFATVVSLMHNDFHDVIAPESPEISAALHALRDAGAPHAMLTGSGSCVFALFERAPERDGVAARCREAGLTTYACAFLTGAAWQSAA